MKKILIAVDKTKGSQSIMSVLKNQMRAPQEVILVHVQRIFGKSLMGDMLGEAEMSTLRESLVGTDHQEALDAESEQIMSYYMKEMANSGLMAVKPVIRSGNPVEEILKVAQEEQVDFMILGSNGKSMLDKLVSGCVTREVETRAGVPVLIAKPQGANRGGTKEGETEPIGVREVYAMQGEK